MKIIQLNLNHCEAAQELLRQTIVEQKIDVAILCEQYKNNKSSAWIHDKTNKVAVWICGNKTIQEKPIDTESYFIRAKVNNMYIYSCYLPPSMDIGEYERTIDKLVKEAITTKPNVIGGDFNAWATEWGSRYTNRRGKILLKAFAVLDVVLLNDGQRHTFEKNGYTSVIDITFASKSLARRSEWYVSEIYTNSDHLALVIKLENLAQKSRNKGARKAQQYGWKTQTLDEGILKTMMDNELIEVTNTNELANQIVKHVKEACDAAMTRKKGHPNRKPIYWWNTEIAELRKRCCSARRRQQRKIGTSEYAGLNHMYTFARRELKKAIKRSKTDSFKQLCDKCDGNPWGEAYKVVMSRLKGEKSQAPSCPILMEKVAKALFPTKNEEFRENLQLFNNNGIQCPEVTKKEVLTAAVSFGNQKAPGLDGFPNEVLKMAMIYKTDPFVNVYNQCLQNGIFPKVWKRQRLVLLQKPNKPSGEPSSYRPLCMIDTLAKILERIVRDRLEAHIESVSGISENQYGFRKKRSTIDAIMKVKSIAEKAIEGERWLYGKKEYCAVVTLDIKNAFNSASWSHIMQTLIDLRTPTYLIRIIRSYLSDRTLLYDTDDGVKYYRVTAGVPQGSVIGPLLWITLYDGVLRLPVPRGVNIVGYADDIAVTIVAKELLDIQATATNVTKKIKTWLEKTGLELAAHKTEAVLITSRKIREMITLNVDGHNITTTPAIKYLGVMIDARLSFATNIEVTCGKASRVHAALARIMANVGGPSQSSRKLLASVTQSVAMYAAPVWSESLKKKSYSRQLKSLFRLSSLRICCGFRTVSHEAANVISGQMPPDILASELRDLYRERCIQNTALTSAERDIMRITSIHRWQHLWDNSLKGRWTHRMIKDIKSWVTRKHGTVDFYMTQFLSGHGCFREYLHKYGHDNQDECPTCTGEKENAEHVFFHCPRYATERTRIEDSVLDPITPENIVKHMLKTEKVWDDVKSWCATIMKDLRREERRRKNDVINRPDNNDTDV